MPVVTVPCSPNGLPMATTPWPTRSPSLESPRLSGCSFDASTSTLITARSEDVSEPTSFASACEPSLKRTVMELAPSTTCALVTMWPSASSTKPDPSPETPWPPPGAPGAPNSPWSVADTPETRMSTTPGREASAMSLTLFEASAVGWPPVTLTTGLEGEAPPVWSATATPAPRPTTSEAPAMAARRAHGALGRVFTKDGSWEGTGLPAGPAVAPWNRLACDDSKGRRRVR